LKTYQRKIIYTFCDWGIKGTITWV